MATKNKVVFVHNYFTVNGVRAGCLYGSSEVWVEMMNAEGKDEPVARFKYRSPKTNAKHWIKFILQYYTPADLVRILRTERSTTPLQLAEKHGYVSPNMAAALKQKAELEARKNTPIVMYGYDANNNLVRQG